MRYFSGQALVTCRNFQSASSHCTPEYTWTAKSYQAFEERQNKSSGPPPPIKSRKYNFGEYKDNAHRQNKIFISNNLSGIRRGIVAMKQEQHTIKKLQKINRSFQKMKNMVGKMKNSTEGLEDKIEKFSQGKKNQRQEMETREKIKQKNQTRTSNSWKKKKEFQKKKLCKKMSQT